MEHATLGVNTQGNVFAVNKEEEEMLRKVTKSHVSELHGHKALLFG